MFFILSKILSFVSDPLSWVLLCFGLALLFNKRKLKLACASAGILLLLILGSDRLRIAAETGWCKNYCTPPDTSVVYDFALVQGGFGEYNPTIKRIQLNFAAERLTESIRLYRKGRVKKLFISGDASASDPDHPEAKRVFLQYMQDMGVKAEDIVIDDLSKNTREGALRTPLFLGANYKGENSLLVTSAVHMRRAMACYRKAGMNPIPYAVLPPVPYQFKITNFGIGSMNLEKWSLLIHELIGMALYRLMGYV